MNREQIRDLRTIALGRYRSGQTGQTVNLLALRLQWFESTPAHTSPFASSGLRMASHPSPWRVNNLALRRSMPFVARRQPSEGGLLFSTYFVEVQFQSTVVRFFTHIADELQSVIAFLFNLLAWVGRIAAL